MLTFWLQFGLVFLIMWMPDCMGRQEQFIYAINDLLKLILKSQGPTANNFCWKCWSVPYFTQGTEQEQSSRNTLLPSTSTWNLYSSKSTTTLAHVSFFIVLICAAVAAGVWPIDGPWKWCHWHLQKIRKTRRCCLRQFESRSTQENRSHQGSTLEIEVDQRWDW